MKRTRRHLAWAIVAGALTVALLGTLPACHRADAAPVARNAILITIDTFRADRLGIYGGRRIHTPAIDRLAADGVVFERAYSTVPLTAPAHSSMMTGRYPATHGVKLNGSSILPDEERTLAEIARDRGMRTGAVVSCLVLASRFGINQGFNLYYEEGISGEEGRRGLWFDERKAAFSIERALRWLRSEPDKPFFLWLHLFDPHHPYDPPPPFNRTYADRLYDGELVYTDRALGGFLRGLDELGLYEDTMIFLSGDHGEGLGDHLESFHGILLYDETMHVPMIVKAPGGRRGEREEGIASIIDVMPTIVDALGLEAPEGTQGISLMPAVMGEDPLPDRTLYMETIYPRTNFGWADVFAIRAANYKYVELPTPELYDLALDAEELDNIHEQAPLQAREARTAYEEMKARLEAASSGKADAAELDEAFRDRLLSLGYIAGTESAAVRENARDPKEVVLLTQPVMYAQGLVKEKKFDEAIDLLERALVPDPENKLALVTLGRVYAGAGRAEDAKRTYRRALEIYPDDEEVHRLLGWILVQERRFDEAVALMAGLVHHAPRSAQAHYLYGFAWFYAGKWDKALEAFEQSTELGRSFAKSWYLMAICYEQTGRREEALAAIDGYLKREPDVEMLLRDPFFVKLRESPEFRRIIRRYL